MRRIKQQCSRPRLLLLAAVLVAGGLWGCGEGDEASERRTPGPIITVSNISQGETATPSETEIAQATRASGLLDVPVLSELLLPDWSEEGEEGALLTEVCPPDELQSIIRVNKTSRLMRGPNEEEARSAVVRLSENSEIMAYAEKLFADAGACARQLAQAWLGEEMTFATAPAANLGEESAVLVSGESAAAVFFRRRLIIVAVLQSGGDAEGSARDLAGLLDQEVIRLLEPD